MDAVLWDMDGLLVDTEPLWTVAEVELAATFGGTWDEDIKAAVVGTRLDVAVPAVLRHFGVPATAEQVAETSQWLLRRMVELFGTDLSPMPGAVALLAALDAEGVPQALVSSSYRVLVDGVLARGYGPFLATLAGDEVVEGKPHPESYIKAAARLGVEPGRCVVLEDSPSGVAAGEAAGCAVVAVPSVHGVSFDAGARRLVTPSLTTVDTAALRALLT